MRYIMGGFAGIVLLVAGCRSDGAITLDVRLTHRGSASETVLEWVLRNRGAQACWAVTDWRRWSADQNMLPARFLLPGDRAVLVFANLQLDVSRPPHRDVCVRYVRVPAGGCISGIIPVTTQLDELCVLANPYERPTDLWDVEHTTEVVRKVYVAIEVWPFDPATREHMLATSDATWVKKLLTASVVDGEATLGDQELRGQVRQFVVSDTVGLRWPLRSARRVFYNEVVQRTLFGCYAGVDACRDGAAVQGVLFSRCLGVDARAGRSLAGE